MRIDGHGIWVKDLGTDAGYSAEERCALMEHPDGDINLPVIMFPTTLGAIRTRLLPILGAGFISPFELADVVATDKDGAKADRDLKPRERRSVLTVMRALIVMANLNRRGTAGSVEKQLEALGFSSPKEQKIREVMKEAMSLGPDRQTVVTEAKR